MAKKQVSKGLSTGKKIGIGAGVAAVAGAAAAGAYYFYGSKNAGKNRKQLKNWAEKAQSEAIKKMKGASKDAYGKAVTQVIKGYRAAKAVAPKELETLSSLLKRQWPTIAKKLKATSAAATKKTAARKKK